MKNHDSLLNCFWKFRSFTFRGPGHSIGRAQVNTTLGLGISIGFPELTFQEVFYYDAQSAQLQIQLIGFETKSVPFFLLKVSTKLDDGWPESVEEQGLLLLVWRRNFRNDL